jgi:molybdopterin-containing oxidoreductase family membrane subunit
MLSGPYLPLFLFEVGVGLVVPFLILAVRRLRRRPAWVALASAIGIIGIFVHRLNLVLNGLSYPNIGLPPGLPVGRTYDGASFATSYFYVPTIIEWLIVLGVLAFGGLLFTAAVGYLPLQQHDVLPAEQGEVVGSRGADDAAAHDDDASVLGQDRDVGHVLVPLGGAAA